MAQREPQLENPPGDDRDLVAGRGKQRGGAQPWDTDQRQARSTRRRDERRRIEGGGCGRRPGGRRFMLVEEVGIGCKREGIQGKIILIAKR